MSVHAYRRQSRKNKWSHVTNNKLEIIILENKHLFSIKTEISNFKRQKAKEKKNVMHLQGASMHIQSTLVISKSKGPPETLRDIRTSTYQISRIEENTNRTTKFHK